MKTSYSQSNMYIQCPMAWSFKYIHKYDSLTEGASLAFGSAVDAAVMDMLEGKTEYLLTFKDKWFNAIRNRKPYPIFDNPNIVYSHADFDEQVLEDKDFYQMSAWAKELNFNIEKEDVVSKFKEIDKQKKNPYKNLTKEEQVYFNRCSWLSLKRKGILLIDAFKEQFYPRVKKVISTQKFGNISDPNEGDRIMGYIDMVLEIEGFDKPVIFDLKTAARPYKKEQIELTEQLTLYAAMKGEEYNTNLVGYVVLVKNIGNESTYTCSKCGNVRTGRHKTCNAMVREDNVVDRMTRCDGEWIEKKILKPEVQVLVEEKSPEQISSLLQDYGNIIFAMKNNVIYRDISKCHAWYGGRCSYFEACHKNDFSKLRKK